jgi:hypothetical protein
VIAELKNNRVSGSSKLNSRHIRDFLFSLLERGIRFSSPATISAHRCLGDVHLASGDPSSAMKCYIEYLAVCSDFFEKHNNVSQWSDTMLFKRMIKCCEMMGCFTQVSFQNISLPYNISSKCVTNSTSYLFSGCRIMSVPP